MYFVGGKEGSRGGRKFEVVEVVEVDELDELIFIILMLRECFVLRLILDNLEKHYCSRKVSL